MKEAEKWPPSFPDTPDPHLPGFVIEPSALHHGQTAPLAVITCHFNWQGYERPRLHLHRFLRQMLVQGIPVYGVEAVLPGQVPQTADLPGWRQIQVDPQRQLLFQKEALLNLAEKLVPSQFCKIAWLDADLWMTHAHWAEETALKLDSFAVVQPFERALWTNREGRINRIGPSVGSRGEILTAGAHPGFAMAARRELWQEYGGIYPWMALGSGDMAFAAAALDLPLTKHHIGLGCSLFFEVDADLYEPWRQKMAQWTGGQMGWVSGDCVHEWHGDRKHRDYARRHERLTGLQTAQHLRLASNGLVEWTEEAPAEFITAARNYFVNRREDG